MDIICVIASVRIHVWSLRTYM